VADGRSTNGVTSERELVYKVMPGLVQSRQQLPLLSKGKLQIKTDHGIFPKKFIEAALDGAPGGAWIVLESNYEGTPLIAMNTGIVQEQPCFLLLQRIQSSL
jgi:hypothetical protein